MEIICPSGLSGTIRGLTVGEAEMLGDRKAARKGSIVENILKSVWVETTNSGPYSFTDDVPWSKVLVADRFYSIIMTPHIDYTKFRIISSLYFK